MEKLGELLILLRKEKGLSQKDVAELLNVSCSAISKWENNQNLPDIVSVRQLADTYGITCDELLHPEQTLLAIHEESSIIQPLPDDHICELQVDIAPTTSPQKRASLWKKLLPHLLVAVLLIAVIILPRYTEYCRKQTFQLVDTTNYLMTELGSVYELIFYHPYESTDEDMLQHANGIEELWKSGHYEDSTEDILVVTYYLSKSDVNQRDKVYFQSFHFLDSTQ